MPFIGYYNFLLIFLVLAFGTFCKSATASDKSEYQHAIEELAKKMGWLSQDDYFKLTAEMLLNEGHYFINTEYSGSVFNLLVDLYPDADFKSYPWLMSQRPKGLWQSKETRLAFLKYVGKMMGWQKEEDFCNLTRAIAKKYGGDRLYSSYAYYNGSTQLLLADLKPDLYCPRFHQNADTRRAKEIEDNKMYRPLILKLVADLYGSTEEDLLDSKCLTDALVRLNSDPFALAYFNKVYSPEINSFSSLLKTTFPELALEKHLKAKYRVNSWKHPNLYPRILTLIANSQGWMAWEDYFQLSFSLLEEFKGQYVFVHDFKENVGDFLKSAFPDVDWEEVQKRYDCKKHKSILLAFMNQKGWTQLEDLYQLSLNEFLEFPESNFLNTYYGSSVHMMLKTLFPHYDWKPWLLVQNEKLRTSEIIDQLGYSPESIDEEKPETMNTHKKIFHDFILKKGWTKFEELYQLTREDFLQFPETSFIDSHYGRNVYRMLTTLFPNYDWKPWLMAEKPKGLWALKETRMAFLEYVGKMMGWHHEKDYCKMTNTIARRFGGSAIYDNYLYYKGSTKLLLADLKPGLDCSEIQKSSKSSKRYERKTTYTHEKEKLRPHVLKFISELHGVSLEDLENQQLLKNNLMELMRDRFARAYFNQAFKVSWLQSLLEDIFPEVSLITDGCYANSFNSWDIPSRRKAILASIGSAQGWLVIDDYSKLTASLISKFQGQHVLRESYQNNVAALLVDIYGNQNWSEKMQKLHKKVKVNTDSQSKRSKIEYDEQKPWLYVNDVQAFWTKKFHQVDLLRYIVKQEGWKSQDECKKGLTYNLLKNYGAESLFAFYGTKHGFDALKIMGQDLCPKAFVGL